MCIAPLIANADQSLFDYLQEINGCYSIPILTIIVVGYLTKHVPAIAAKVALFSGVGLYVFSQFWLKNEVGEDDYPHFLHVMAILFVLNVIVMLVLEKLPSPTAYQLNYSKDVEVTLGSMWAWPALALLYRGGDLCLVFLIYQLLSSPTVGAVGFACNIRWKFVHTNARSSNRVSLAINLI